MSKSIKILAILGQVLFAWIYSSATNFCNAGDCVAKSYISFILIVVSFAIFDLYFLKLYPRFKNISQNVLTAIILIFPILFYLVGIILNAITKKPLSVIVVGIIIIILSYALWMVIARVKFSQKLTEYLAIKSYFLFIVAVGFLIASLNFAISSYLKYSSPYSDVYITENNGKKVNFINYKFR